MADRLPLANGSEWDGDVIVESDGTRIELRETPPGVPGFEAGSPFFQVGHSDDSGCAWPEDLRAALEANGYLDEFKELAKLRQAAYHAMVCWGSSVTLRTEASMDECCLAFAKLDSLLPKEGKKDG